MILYLSRNENANLLDRAAKDNAMHIMKMQGIISLSEFIIVEMRKYASCKFFCIDRLAATENDDEFLEALKSFRMMFEARVVVMLDDGNDSLVQGLLDMGITDIVTAADERGRSEQIAECLSPVGMLKNLLITNNVVKSSVVDMPDVLAESTHIETITPLHSVPSESNFAMPRTLAQDIVTKDTDGDTYRFDCINVNIGIIGATRRVGTTTVALGLVNYIRNSGGTACYVAFNTNQHLESIVDENNFDIEDDYFTFDAIDFYEEQQPKYDYNFIVTDYGDMKLEYVRKFKLSDICLLCGASYKQAEIMEFADALTQVRSVNPQIVTYMPNPKLEQIFSAHVSDNPVIIKPVKNMMDYMTNADFFKQIVKPYIVETAKRL